MRFSNRQVQSHGIYQTSEFYWGLGTGDWGLGTQRPLSASLATVNIFHHRMLTTQAENYLFWCRHDGSDA
ncbi:MAG: hypothetical protein ACFKPT_22320 [Gloeotrichia echinulata GP01]